MLNERFLQAKKDRIEKGGVHPAFFAFSTV